MEQTEQNDLFGAKINDSGKIYIRKFASIVRPVILIGIIISLIRLVQELIHAIKVNPEIYKHNSLLFFENSLMPYYTIVHTVLFFIQIYYYSKMSRLLTKGINQDSEMDLNNSFKALFQYTFYGLIALILSLALSVLDFYLTIKIHL